MNGMLTTPGVGEGVVAREWRSLGGWREGRMWRRLLYLLLAFPLGLAYAVFLITGIALGAGLAVTLVGLPILAGMMLAWRQFGRFERLLARHLLGVDLAASTDQPAAAGPVARLKATVVDGFTWRSLGYLLAEFPFGIATFVVMVTLLSLDVALTTAPLFFWAVPDGGGWSVGSFPRALVACVAGLALLWITPRLVNGIAGLWAAFARRMLGPR